MATGGYRSAGGSTTDFLEEWKAKREKMRAKQAPPAPGAAAGGEARPAGGTSSAELSNNLPPGGPAAPPDRAAPPAEPPPALAGGRGAEPAAKPPPAAAPGSPEGEEKLAAKGKSSGPSARKGKGQIEKRKLREKRRSTGVVNIPAAE
ncbi:PAWR protein, partial [Nyctiprogne leucopyga]|nr:PAWR protein [Nyctiprogne leucopyga]